jgi:hypothetical protein
MRRLDWGGGALSSPGAAGGFGDLSDDATDGTRRDFQLTAMARPPLMSHSADCRRSRSFQRRSSAQLFGPAIGGTVGPNRPEVLAADGSPLLHTIL